MEKQFLMRPNQHVKSADFSSMQAYTRASLDHVVNDGIDDGRKYYGLETTKTGPTETTTAIGRLYSSGAVFVKEVQAVFSHIAKLPAVTEKIATIVVWGLEVEEAIEPRAFVTDANASPPVFEPQEVTTRKTRALQIDCIYGAESASPVRGVIDSGVIPVADILLDTTGVVSVTMVEENRLRSVGENQEELDDLAAWRLEVAQQIDTLRSDLAKLEAKIPPDLSPALAAMAQQIAAIFAILNRPAAAFATYVDRFRNLEDSDTDEVGYSAEVSEGLTFPESVVEQNGIALLNPLETKVKSVNNIMLPAYTEVTRLKIHKTTFTGQLIIVDHPVVTVSHKHCKHSRRCTRYGGRHVHVIAAPPVVSVVDNLTALSYIDDDPLSLYSVAEIKRRPHFHHWHCKRVGGELYGDCDWDRFWKKCKPHKIICKRHKRCSHDHYDVAYWPTVITTASNMGSTISQVWLNANNGWMTSVGLHFHTRGAAGDVQVLVCETDANGQPDIDSVISTGSLTHANINTSGACKVTLTPAYLEGGTRYALVVITQGSHVLRCADSNRYSMGCVYHRNSSNVWVLKASNDICMEINMAQFNSTRVEVELEPASLAGGIGAVRATYAGFVPAGTSLHFEVLNGGIWRALDDGEVDALSGNPSLLPLRAVFSGTRDLMPSIDLTQSELELSRVATTFTHFSLNREYDSTATKVVVTYFVNGWDDDHHELACTLILDGTPESPDSTVKTPDPSDPAKYKIEFTFDGVSEDDVDNIKTVGSTDGAEYGFFTITDRWDHAYA